MANMSYCRFHNTKIDVEDCLDVLAGNGDISSESERNSAIRMIKDILEFCEDMGIIDEYDEDELIKTIDAAYTGE